MFSNSCVIEGHSKRSSKNTRLDNCLSPIPIHYVEKVTRHFHFIPAKAMVSAILNKYGSYLVERVISSENIRNWNTLLSPRLRGNLKRVDILTLVIFPSYIIFDWDATDLYSRDFWEQGTDGSLTFDYMLTYIGGRCYQSVEWRRETQ